MRVCSAGGAGVCAARGRSGGGGERALGCARVQLFVLRKTIEDQIRSKLGLGDDDVFFASLSSRTIVYKGQLTPSQVRAQKHNGGQCH